MITLAQHLAAHQYTDTCDGWESCDCGWREEQERRSESGSVFTHAEHVAATWQQARTITTIDQLDALPALSIIRETIGSDGLTKTIEGLWRCDDNYTPFAALEINLPALVVWTPADGGDQ